QGRKPAQVIVVGQRVSSRPVRGIIRRVELRCNGVDYGRRDLGLELEGILERGLEGLGPEMRSADCIDELRVNIGPVRSLAHASFQDIANAELATDVLDVRRTVSVGQA